MNMHIKLHSTRPKSTRTKPSKPNNPWTQEEIAQLSRSMAKGLSYEAIGNDLCRTAMAVRHQCYARGIKRHGRQKKTRPDLNAQPSAQVKINQEAVVSRFDEKIASIAAQNPVQQKPVPFFELEKGQCRFVVDSSSGMAMNCCGAPVMGGKGDARKRTHCEHHYKASTRRIK
jgi:hypothetical protein